MIFATVTNLILIGLCPAVLVQSARVMRSFHDVKSGDLGDTVKSLDRATTQARVVLAELKELLSTDGAANARTIALGENLRDELSVMVGIGNAVAERIMDSATAAGEAGKRQAEADAPRKPAPKASSKRGPRVPAATASAATH